jgi:glycosyltransferase involved in cell wall biosynthesis
MNVLQIHASDTGGAADAALTLHRGLRRAGHRSRLLVGRATAAHPDVVELPRAPRPRGFRLPRAAYVRAGLGDWAQRRRTLSLIEAAGVREADVIVLHNLHGGYFDYRVLPRLSARTPLVWSLHDMWALTGHCAYAYDCERWVSGCHDCPQFRLPPEERRWTEPPAVGCDRSRLLWRSKRKAYAGARLHVVVSCRWMEERVRRSILAGAASLTRIHDGVETEVYRPIERASARAALDLPAEGSVLLAFPQSGRKGGAHLLGALERTRPPGPLTVLCVGSDPAFARTHRRFPVRSLGYVHAREVLNLCFGAADLFVLPTRADNVPLSATAALAAGLPTVAFDVGGVSEVVRHMETGYLARARDEEDLARGIDLLLADAALRRRLAGACREAALRDFSAERSVGAYVSLFERVAGER